MIDISIPSVKEKMLADEKSLHVLEYPMLSELHCLAKKLHPENFVFGSIFFNIMFVRRVHSSRMRDSVS